MKIGELEQHCGNCHLIDLCGEPFGNVMLCANEALADMEEEEYRFRAEEIRKNPGGTGAIRRWKGRLQPGFRKQKIKVI